MLNNNHNTTKPAVKTPVRAQGKIIGYLSDNRFTKPVIASKHKLRCPPAWAIDAEAFDREVKPNATDIVIIDKETGTKYHASIETFMRHSFKLNRGFGEQWAMPIQFWQVEDNGQLSFFEGGSDSDV